MATKTIKNLFTFATVVMDNSDATYKYTGLTLRYGADTNEAVWLITRETKAGNTQGTMVYSANPMKLDTAFIKKWDDRATITYNNDVNIEN